jgi:nucleoside-diphosphate-sugar epimerase
MKVLLTGGRGLIGGVIAHELLDRGHEVTLLQRTPSGLEAHERLTEQLGDIRDLSAVNQACRGMDGVIHAAALVGITGSWSDFESANVQGTQSVLDAARAAGVSRFVYVSSPSVAHSGKALVGAAAGVADPDSARGHYARSKAIAERVVLAQSSATFASAAIRPHLVWGPGDEQLVGRIVDRARSGRLVLIDHGRALIDSTYSANVGSAVVSGLERVGRADVNGRAFVVSNGEPRTVAELVTRIVAAAGLPAPTRSIPYRAAYGAGALVEGMWRISGRRTEPPMTRFLAEQLATAHWFDQRETQIALDWRPRVSLDEGFVELGNWYRTAGGVAD